MNLYYTGVDGNARKFVEEMESSGTADAIRAEEGNLRYDYFFSAADPETVLLIDSWTSQEAIDAHHATPMMHTIADPPTYLSAANSLGIRWATSPDAFCSIG